MRCIWDSLRLEELLLWHAMAAAWAPEERSVVKRRTCYAKERWIKPGETKVFGYTTIHSTTPG